MTNLNDLINSINQDIQDFGGNHYADLVMSVMNGTSVAIKDLEALLPNSDGAGGNPDLLELLFSRAVFTTNKSADNIKNLIEVAEKDSGVKTSIQNAAGHILLNLESLDDSDGYLFVNSTENAVGTAVHLANQEFTKIIGEKLLPYANFKQGFDDVSDLASMVVGITKRYMSHNVSSTVVQNFVDGALKNVTAFANATMFNWLHDVFHQNYVPVDLPSDIENGELLVNQGWSEIKGIFETHAKNNGIDIPVVNESYEFTALKSASVYIADSLTDVKKYTSTVRSDIESGMYINEITKEISWAGVVAAGCFGGAATLFLSYSSALVLATQCDSGDVSAKIKAFATSQLNYSIGTGIIAVSVLASYIGYSYFSKSSNEVPVGANSALKGDETGSSTSELHKDSNPLEHSHESDDSN